MDRHSLDILEFDRIRKLLAAHAQCSLGRELAATLEPSPDRARIARRLDELRNLRDLVAVRGLPPFGGITDVRPHIHRAVPPANLEPENFSAVADALRGVASLRRWFAEGATNPPPRNTASSKPPLPAPTPLTGPIAALASRIGDFSHLAERIDNVIDRRGKVRDDATPRLARIRAHCEQLRRDIADLFERLLRLSHITKLLQYPAATFHGDRMVLPLKSDHRGRIPGIIHRSSDSGQTLFIEPTQAVELNNAIIQRTQDEAEEIARILWELTHLIHLNQAALLATFDAVAVVDLIVAKLRMAKRFDMAIPIINPNHALSLRAARNPTLLAIAVDNKAAGAPERKVVPIDVRLGEDFDVLMVTGPNTGGKTAALKTVGLLALMAQTGLPIPAADGSTLPVFDDVLVDIGDEQSLQQSLSTFSAHLARVLEVLQRGTRNTLVLIDELGAGTDPDDGAALGRAVIDRLLDTGCLTMITTHLGALKAVGYEHPRVDNACVQFDYETLQPSYALTIGEPGNSSALIIAARLGMPTDLVSLAQRYLSERDRTLARAIAGTIESRRGAEEARKLADEARRAADEQARAAATEKQRLADEQQRFQNWVARINSLRPGETVRVKRFDREGKIVHVHLHKQLVKVAVGALELEVPLTDLDL